MHAFISKKSTFPIVVIYLMYNWNKTQKKILGWAYLSYKTPTLCKHCQLWDWLVKYEIHAHWTCCIKPHFKLFLFVCGLSLNLTIDTTTIPTTTLFFFPCLFSTSLWHGCAHDQELRLSCYQFAICGNHVEWCSSLFPVSFLLLFSWFKSAVTAFWLATYRNFSRACQAMSM